MLSKTIQYISDTYISITILHPQFWFNSRSAPGLNHLVIYAVFIALVFALSVFFFWLALRRAKNPFEKKFFYGLGWWALGFALLAGSITGFHLLSLSLLSARAVWVLFFFALFFLSYLKTLEFVKKLPEKTISYEKAQIKKRYLRPFKKKH